MSIRPFPICGRQLLAGALKPVAAGMYFAGGEGGFALFAWQVDTKRTRFYGGVDIQNRVFSVISRGRRLAHMGWTRVKIIKYNDLTTKLQKKSGEG